MHSKKNKNGKKHPDSFNKQRQFLQTLAASVYQLNHKTSQLTAATRLTVKQDKLEETLPGGGVGGTDKREKRISSRYNSNHTIRLRNYLVFPARGYLNYPPLL